MRSLPREPLRLLVWLVLYVAAGVLGRLTIIDGQALSLVWPAAGIGVLWLATSSRRRLPLDLLAMAGVVFAVNAVTGASAGLAAVLVVTNLVQALLFVGAVRRLRPDLHGFGGTRGPGSLPDLGALACSAALTCLVAAALGQVGLAALGQDPSLTSTAVWWGRNLTGILTVGVLGLLVLARYAAPAAERRSDGDHAAHGPGGGGARRLCRRCSWSWCSDAPRPRPSGS